MSNLLVSLVAEWKGAAAFNKAETATDKLSKGVKTLGRNLGLALGAAGLAKFAKDSIKAFAEEEKSIAMLSNALNNLGMGEQSDKIYSFIDSLQMATGVSDDQLRPAFLRLATAGLSAADAQSMLSLAMDVSAGTGKDLQSVTNALAKAAEGNTTALQKLGVGLTKDELATMSLNDITMKLADTYKNAASKSADTFAGKIARLQVAAETAKEVIGKGLVDALIAVTGSLDIQDMSNKIVVFATNLADIFVKLGNLIGQNIAFIKSFGVAIIAVFTATKVYAGALAMISIIQKIQKAFKLMREVSIGAAIASMAAINPLAALLGGGALIVSIVAATKLMDSLTSKDPVDIIVPPDFSGLDDPKFKKIKADEIKAEKIKAANLKKEMANKKALSIFDLEAIQIMAALRGQISDDERKRLELQLAIITGAEGQAQKLTGELAKSQGLTVQLTQWLQNLPSAKNPFMAWKGYLDEVELQAKRIADFGKTGDKAITPRLDFGGNALGTMVPDFVPPSWAKQLMSSGSPSFSGQDFYGPMGAASPIVNVQVVLDNGVVAGAVTETQVNQSLSGTFSDVSRYNGRGAPSIK
jgi:hypothetical protein